MYARYAAVSWVFLTSGDLDLRPFEMNLARAMPIMIFLRFLFSSYEPVCDRRTDGWVKRVMRPIGRSHNNWYFDAQASIWTPPTAAITHSNIWPCSDLALIPWPSKRNYYFRNRYEFWDQNFFRQYRHHWRHLVARSINFLGHPVYVK